MKKILSIIGIIALISLIFVPIAASAPVNLFNGGGVGDEHGGIRANDNSTALANQVVALFTSQDNGYLTTITLPMQKVGAANATVRGVLYNSTLGLLATSITTINASELTTSFTDITFQFNQTYALVDSVNYYAGVEVIDGTLDATTNYIEVSMDNTDFSNTNLYAYPCRYTADNTWYYSYHTLVDLVVNGEDVSAGGTPAPTEPPGNGDEDIENLTAIILPWLVPLLICLIPALLGYKFVGELGFFIGLNVGCILAYVTLMGTAYAFPLWGIILVGVMDVAVVIMRR